LTFFTWISCRSVQLQIKTTSLYPLQNIHLFAAILRPFSPVRQHLNTCDLISAYMPVKFCPDPLRFAGVIREKPILSKNNAWQRATRHAIEFCTLVSAESSWWTLFSERGKLRHRRPITAVMWSKYTLALRGWAVAFVTSARTIPSHRCTKRNSPPLMDQCIPIITLPCGPCCRYLLRP